MKLFVREFNIHHHAKNLFEEDEQYLKNLANQVRRNEQTSKSYRSLKYLKLEEKRKKRLERQKQEQEDMRRNNVRGKRGSLPPIEKGGLLNNPSLDLVMPEQNRADKLKSKKEMQKQAEMKLLTERAENKMKSLMSLDSTKPRDENVSNKATYYG